jgi:hypothetical protein
MTANPAGCSDAVVLLWYRQRRNPRGPIPDTRILIREWPAGAVSQDGRIESAPMRPVYSLAVPSELPVEAKRRLVHRRSAAIGGACGREDEEVGLPSGTSVKTNWVLTLFRQYPLERAALGDLLATENPMVLESLEGAFSPSSR